MTDDDLRAIAARLEAITPGEWIADDGGGISVYDPDDEVHNPVVSYVRSTPDTAFIANAPTDIKRLLRKVDAQASELRDMATVRDELYAALREKDERIAALEAALHEAEKHNVGFERSIEKPDGCHFCSLCGAVAEHPQMYTTIKHEASCPYSALDD